MTRLWDIIPLWKMGFVEHVNTKEMTEEWIQKIYEIEQDMWAHGLGSYIWCNNCEEISSKQDLYGELDRTIQILTVTRIEQLLETGVPDCPSCGSDSTNHIFDENYRDSDITQRYQFDESFLTVYKDTTGEVKGFINAYISDFDTIYTKEFAPFYGEDARSMTYEGICRVLGDEMPDKILALNNMWAEQWCVSMTLLYHLLKTICQDISQYQPNITWIYDSIIGNKVHSMHRIIWGQRLHITDHLQENSINMNFPTDIMPHPNAIETTLRNLWDSSFSFFKQHAAAIKSVVNA